MTTTTTFALPVPEANIAALRQFVAELLGPRRDEFSASWQAKGIRRERAWLQPTPDGVLVLISMEADDLPRAIREIALSPAPFDRWYREQVQAVYGVDLAAAPDRPPNELLADWTAP